MRALIAYAHCLFLLILVVQAIKPLNWRFWLCEQSIDGTLFIKRCLNQAGSREVFGNICNEWDDSHGWIKLFLKDKKVNEELQPINHGSIIVFCKYYESDFNAVHYLGHLLVDKTLPCVELVTKILRMAELSNKLDYSVYTEEGSSSIREISQTQESLAEVSVLEDMSANQ